MNYEEENAQGRLLLRLSCEKRRASGIEDTLFPHLPSSIRGCCCSNVAGAHVAMQHPRCSAVLFISRKTPLRFSSSLNLTPRDRDTLRGCTFMSNSRLPITHRRIFSFRIYIRKRKDMQSISRCSCASNDNVRFESCQDTSWEFE